MKKYLMVLLIGILVLTGTACSKEEVKKPDTKRIEKKKIYRPTAPVEKNDNTKTIIVPNEELEKTAKLSSDYVIEFFEKQTEAELLFSKMTSKELEDKLFEEKYGIIIAELKAQTTMIENTAKKEGLNDSEQKYIGYFKDMVRILENKGKLFNENGDLDIVKLKRLSKEMDKLTNEYDKLFVVKELS